MTEEQQFSLFEVAEEPPKEVSEPAPAENGAPSAAPPDEQQRRLIRGDDRFTHPISHDPDILLDRNIVVRAGAGSGKTRSLVDRMVALVRSGVPAKRIAAITFTIKAAGELRTRFAETLREAARVTNKKIGTTTEEELRTQWRDERERLLAAERDLEHMFLGTVHAFCGRILRERPFEAGLSPDFGHIDPGLVMEHRRRFWAGFVKRASSNWVDRFEAVGLEPDQLFRFFADRANNEDVALEGVLMQQPMPDLGPAAHAATELVAEIQAMAAFCTREDALKKEAAAIARFLDREGLDIPLKQARLLMMAEGMAKKSNVRVTYWGPRGSDSFNWAKDKRDGFERWAAENIEGPLTAWREFVFYEAGQFVDDAVQEYSELRRRTGDQTFDDLLWGAKRMLEKSPENRKHFARKFSHILVDEFQDTDPVQAEILLYLSSVNRSEKNPWKCEPRPGSLFIVGDDKQSIYRFRRADVEVFRRFEEVLLAHGGERVSLTTNFRSDERICGFVNGALRPVFEAPFQRGQAEWEDLVPFTETGTPKHPVAVARIGIPEETHKYRDKMAEAEAPLIASAVAQLVRAGGVAMEDGSRIVLRGEVGWGDVMVLFRTATVMPVYVEALNALGIPYSIAGGKTLGKVDSLRLILDPLDAVLCQDAVAMVAFLRGPFCGATDVDLVEYVEAGGFLRMPPPREDSQVEPPVRIAAGFDALRDLRARFLRDAPADALEGWVEDRGILGGLALMEGGASLAGSMIRILAMVRAWDAAGMSWPEVIEELHRLQDEDIEAEQLTLDGLEGDAVQLMTVHQAKGLEAKVVILADPLGKGKQGNDIVVDRTGREPTLGAKIDSWGEVVAQTPDWKARHELDLALEESEELRLAYVASTRAEELLLIGHHTRADGPWFPFAQAALAVPAFGGIQAEAALAAGRETVSGAIADEAPRTVEDIEAELAAEQALIERLSQPTYREARASDGDDRFFVTEADGRGKGYGTLVHRLFESMVLHRDEALDGSWIQRVAARHAADTIEEDERAERIVQAMRDAEVFMNSDAWRRLAEADEVHAELPYTYAMPGSAIELETVHTGVIDLAYRVGETWHVVDYKTDPLAPEDLVEKHGEQLEAYATALRTLAGATAVRNAIWSTHHGELVRLN